jgi:hypothetical protein
MLAYEMHGYIFDEYLLPMPVLDVIIKYLVHLFTLFSTAYLFYILYIFNANNPKSDSPDIIRWADGAPQTQTDNRAPTIISVSATQRK